MREIKFRAWDKENKVMVHPKGILFDGRVVNFSCGILEPFEGCELMQFTGLYDKNGKEIYEGDIARITGGAYWQGYHELDIKGEVVMEYGSFGIREKDGFFNPLLACEPYDGEIHIIGNIYKNPELIEGETK